MRNQICGRCFYFLFFFPVHVKLPGEKKRKEKENVQKKKKNLKGIVYLFDSLRILFSYNLSAIKRGFSFFISSISFVCFCYLCEGIVCSIKQIIWLITAEREYLKRLTPERKKYSLGAFEEAFALTRTSSPRAFPRFERNSQFQSQRRSEPPCVTRTARSVESPHKYCTS